MHAGLFGCFILVHLCLPHDQSEGDISAGVVTLTWLGIAIAGATAVVLIITSLYAFCWFRSDRWLYDMAEKKSVAGSSQRGVYRSRNSLQVVNLPPLGDLPIPPPAERDDHLDGQHDDSLKQVPERPEEEEAEAIEMVGFSCVQDWLRAGWV